MDFEGNTQQNPQIEERKYTISEYFDFETTSERGHEYYDGLIVECAYTSVNHASIVHNLSVLLGNFLRKKDYKIYLNSRMLYAKGGDRFYYPDIVVVHGKSEYYQHSKNQVATANPSVLIEVVSDLTLCLDRGDKLKYYRQIPSLKQYVIVEQDFKSVEIYEYDKNSKRWGSILYEDEGNIVRIADCDIPLNEIYFKVDLIKAI